MKPYLIIIIFLSFSLNSLGQLSVSDIVKNFKLKTEIKDSVRKLTDADPLFPFHRETANTEYDFYIDIMDSSVMRQFVPAFKHNNLKYTTDVMEEVINQMVFKTNREIRPSIITSAMERVVLIGCGNEQYRRLFLQDIRPVMNDPKRFNSFLKIFDRSNLPDE